MGGDARSGTEVTGSRHGARGYVWTVRVTVREGMIRWLAEEHPYAQPRVNTADAALRPAGDGYHRPRRSPGTGRRRFPEQPTRTR